MAIYDGNNLPSNYRIRSGDIINFDYSGSEKYINLLVGRFLFEAWGSTGSTLLLGGAGYVKGYLNLITSRTLYLHVGGLASTSSNLGGYNGGGRGYSTGKGGGGSTDIRLSQGLWNDTLGLNSRIMVASGSSNYTTRSGFDVGDAGGLIGYQFRDYNYPSYVANGGSQVAGGSVVNFSSSYTLGTPGVFGYAGNGGGAQTEGSYGGGSGYYGGAGGPRLSNGSWAGGGGSSFISGHPGCIAIRSSSDRTPKVQSYSKPEDSYHYSGLIFYDTSMIDGRNYMPNPRGTGNIVGNKGNGFIRITAIEVPEYLIEDNGILKTWNGTNWISI